MSQGVSEQQERLPPLQTEVRLAEDTVLTDDFLRQLINVGEVDILVGLPTHNNSATIGGVIQAIQAGLLKAFPRERAAIVNADGGSRDGTRELVAAASIDDVRRASNMYTLRTLHSISTEYAPTPSSGVALKTILAAAELLRAKACVIISPESTNIEPDWIPHLLKPIYSDNTDLVTPLYRRHKFEGLLVRNVIYPMFRAVYGRRLREPSASEYAVSGRLASQFLSQNSWDSEFGQTGAEICLAVAALTQGFRLQQVFLGAKIHSDRGSADLVPAIRQTVGTLFFTMEHNYPAWTTIRDSQPVTFSGPESELTLDPLRVNRKRLYDNYRSGVSELDPVFKSILTEPTLTELQRLAAMDEENFRYPADLWVKTIYEFAASYHNSVINRDHILQALAPLYRGRIFTFLVENRNGSAQDVENSIELLCCEFERQKPYLLELWQSERVRS